MSTEQELKKAVDGIGAAFEQFKANNDKALAELRASGAASAESKAAADKANADITALTAKMTELQRDLRAQETARAREVIESNPKSAEARAKARQDCISFLALTTGRKPAEIEPTEGDMQAMRTYEAAFKAHLKMGDNITPDFKAALSVGADSQGGIWAPPDLNGRLVQLLYETSPMRQVANIATTSAPDYEGYNDLNEASSGWVGEQSSRSETGAPDPAAGAWKIPLNEQYANPRATQRMLDFSIRDPESWLLGKIADKITRVENAAFVSSTGGPAKPRGFTTYTAGTPTAANWNRIQQLATGTSGAFAASKPGDVLLNAIFAVKAPYRQNARWLMGRLTLAEVRKLVDGQGNYLWQRDFQQSVAGSLCGYPITEAEDMPAIAANSLSIGFGDWKQGFQIVDHTTGLRILRDNLTAKPFIQFYSTKYVGGDVVNFEAIKLIKFG